MDFCRFFLHDIGPRLFEAVNYFFCISSLPHSWANTYVALITKSDKPKKVADYCLISLFNVCYKNISKIMTNRLKHILQNLIGREQCGFIADHNPMDNILTV